MVLKDLAQETCHSRVRWAEESLHPSVDLCADPVDPMQPVDTYRDCAHIARSPSLYGWTAALKGPGTLTSEDVYGDAEEEEENGILFVTPSGSDYRGCGETGPDKLPDPSGSFLVLPFSCSPLHSQQEGCTQPNQEGEEEDQDCLQECTFSSGP